MCAFSWNPQPFKECREGFKRLENLHDVLFRHDYAERVVSSFARQLQI